MDLNELKKTWCQASENTPDEVNIDAKKIDQLLQKRGSGILSRLDRNVKIGFWLLGLFFILTLADQYLPVEKILPATLNSEIEIPVWIRVLSLIVSSIVMLTFILFVIRYNNLKIKSLAALDMPTALRKVLRLLDTFKREFYLALAVFLSATITGFLYGAWTGFTIATDNESLTLQTKILIFLVMLALLCLFIGIIFFIFHKGFNTLYGKYREQLIKALDELEEVEE